jgi:hypothetical protein
MLHLSIFLCLVPNVTRVYLSLSWAQSYLCLSVFVTQKDRQGNIGHKTNKDDTGNMVHKKKKDRPG